MTTSTSAMHHTSRTIAEERPPVQREGAPGKVRLANADQRYGRPRLIEPSPAGFLHVAVQTAAQRRPGPVSGRDQDREQALAALSAFGEALLGTEGIREVAVFRAVLVAPAPGDRASRSVQPDVALLVETATPSDALALAASTQLGELLDRLHAGGARTHIVAARNARRIADVDHSPGGLFLFNHFFGVDEGVAIELCKYLAAWYQRETGLDNSMLLAPVQGQESVFALVNHAHFDMSLPRLAMHQFAKRSFFTYVRANLNANGVVVMPVLYRLTWAGRA